ncbi:hypothetical protein CN1A_7 [Clavibacter phage CN1A]|uniref:Uncharacterized protein n=1 Tax=Clavibacter phage CN1A TaxID=1406793 RepID=U5PTP3_9CAUD|nr:hypothetical protein CN1A_7 [Clavibacter phage CN1A]AGY47116.1 hypothetical protein CN1A_7 [Clavibacter phage CN1A]
MSTTIKEVSTYPEILQVTVAKEHDGYTGPRPLLITLGGHMANMAPQELFDALRAEGFVDTPKTVRDLVREMEVGTRFKIDQLPDVIYVRSEKGFKSEGNSTYELKFAALVPDIHIITVLPPLPKGDMAMQGLQPGNKFYVGDESFIKTRPCEAVSLRDGTVYGSGYFADKTVKVSK